MSAAKRVREIVDPILAGTDSTLYDVEFESGILRVMVDRPNGIDVDTIGDLAQQISAALDADDPLPGQRYLLEVTSPGIERKLRLPEHFVQQIGSEVNVKLKLSIDGLRRLDGSITEADETGFTVLDESGEEPISRTLRYDDVESARTIFRWATVLENESKPSSSRSQSPSTKNKSTNKKASTR